MRTWFQLSTRLCRFQSRTLCSNCPDTETPVTLADCSPSSFFWIICLVSWEGMTFEAAISGATSLLCRGTRDFLIWSKRDVGFHSCFNPKGAETLTPTGMLLVVLWQCCPWGTACLILYKHTPCGTSVLDLKRKALSFPCSTWHNKFFLLCPWIVWKCIRPEKRIHHPSQIQSDYIRVDSLAI